MAWQSGALSAGYMQKVLADFSRQMLTIESNEVAPAGWRAVWDRYGISSFLISTLATFHCYDRSSVSVVGRDCENT